VVKMPAGDAAGAQARTERAGIRTGLTMPANDG